MIICSICNTSNHHLAVNCSSCGGYVQTRVDTLDLFSTVWRVIEKPSKAFHAIAISRHKNYVFGLSSVAGIAIAFTIFWAIKALKYADSAVNIFLAGFIAGPVFGILFLLLFAVLVMAIARSFRLSAGLKGTFAVIAYASVPLVIITLFIFPVEMLTFGPEFFSDNPSPYTIKPLAYIALLILHGGFVFWNFVLLVIGVRALIDVSWMKSIGVWLIAVSALGGILYAVLHVLLANR